MSLHHSPRIVTSGLVLYLDAANKKSYPGTGNIWTDLSGNGNNGTLVNGVAYSNTNSGMLVFDGVNDYVQIPHSPAIAPTSAISLSAWANTDWQTTSSVRILSKTEGGGWQLSINDDPAGEKTGMTIHISGIYRYVTVNKSLVSPGYHNLVGTFDGRYAKLYIDSVLLTQVDAGAGSVLTYSVNNPLLIAAEPGSSAVAGNYTNATISCISLYNQALTAQEIRQNFNALRGRYGL